MKIKHLKHGAFFLHKNHIVSENIISGHKKRLPEQSKNIVKYVQKIISNFMQNTIDFYNTNRLYYYRRQNTQNIYSLITLRSGATFRLNQPDNERKQNILALLVISQSET